MAAWIRPGSASPGHRSTETVPELPRPPFGGGEPEGRRAAYFHCVLVLRGPGGVEQVFTGRCDGVLAREPAGGAGFGYDPLFIPHGFDRTYAQLNEGEKNKISHRGRAWVLMADYLRNSS